MADARSSGSPSRTYDGWPWFVGLLGVALAGQLLMQFWPVAAHLWVSLEHDRHVHYLQGLTIGMSIRNGDVASLFRQLERLQVWGILHPFTEGVVQLCGGPNYRLAVLPSLLGVGRHGSVRLFARAPDGANARLFRGRLGGVIGVCESGPSVVCHGHHARKHRGLFVVGGAVLLFGLRARQHPPGRPLADDHLDDVVLPQVELLGAADAAVAIG